MYVYTYMHTHTHIYLRKMYVTKCIILMFAKNRLI